MIEIKDDSKTVFYTVSLISSIYLDCLNPCDNEEDLIVLVHIEPSDKYSGILEGEGEDTLIIPNPRTL
jgi:hypothetical protein